MTNNSNAYSWKNSVFGDCKLVSTDGQIVGRVIRTYGEFSAHIRTRPLGDYVDLPSAKRAVERALGLIPALATPGIPPKVPHE